MPSIHAMSDGIPVQQKSQVENPKSGPAQIELVEAETAQEKRQRRCDQPVLARPRRALVHPAPRADLSARVNLSSARVAELRRELAHGRSTVRDPPAHRVSRSLRWQVRLVRAARI
jgi:hypothetical protein